MSSYGSGSYYSSAKGNYDDRRYQERNETRSRFSDSYRDSDFGARRQSRFSPPSYSGSQRGDRHQDQRSKAVSYPLGHLGHQGSSRSDYDRDDRDIGYNRNRNNTRNRSGGMRGSISVNEGPGILGAKPGTQLPSLTSDLSSPMPGLGLTGLSPEGLRAQIAQQQQQLMAMVQTQSLLAAVQAQAQSQTNQRPPQFNAAGLLPTPPMLPDRRNQPQMRKRRNESQMQGGNYGKRDRQSFDNRNRNQQGYSNRRSNQWGQRQNRRSGNNSQQQKKLSPRPLSRSASETRGEKPRGENEASKRTGDDTSGEKEDIMAAEPTSDGEKGDSEAANMEDSKGKLQTAKPCTVVNFLGQDVEEMVKKLFNKIKQKYVCTPCKIICIKESSFRQHLRGKRHSKTILESEGKELDLDEWRKFHEPVDVEPVPEQPEKPAPVESQPEESDMTTITSNQDAPQSPVQPQSDEECEFVKYSCNTRKMAVKNGDIITISSITEASVRISGFTSEKNMFGCEFVKAVAGFNCRLCKSFIRYGKDVTGHIQGKKHQRNYQLFIQEHPQYVENQLSRNKELEEILEKREGEEVVLYEVLDADIRKSRRRRKDSQGTETTQLPITKFVVEEDKANHEAPGEDLEATEDEAIEESLLKDADDMYSIQQPEVDDDMEQVTEEDIVEREKLLLMEDEKEAVNDVSQDSVECIVHEDQLQMEDEEEPPITTSPDTRVTSSGRSESESESVLPQKKEQSTTPRRMPAVKVEPKPESADSESQDEKVSPAPTGRRGGKRAGRGGRTTGRGRGRGRGTRRSARNTVAQATVEVAKEEEQAVDADADDISFMDGFEVIDEINEED